MEYSDVQKNELKEEYDSYLPRLREAERRLLDMVQQAIGRINDKRLVRVNVRPSRIKSFESLRRKAEIRDLQPKQACLSIDDLIGVRIVCNTIEDVYRFRELFGEVLPADEHVDEQDYIAEPKESGYRGLHLNFRIEVGGLLNLLRIPCEVQIRTLLQDSWAELVHSDIYKDGAMLPEDLRGRTQDMAGILSAADQAASRVRARIMQETKVEPESVRLDSLTKEGLAYIFAQVFGRSPPDYAVQRAYEACLDAGISAIGSLRDKLANKNFREMVAEAYKNELRIGFNLNAEEILALAPLAVTKGDAEATKEARRIARIERREIDAIWRREVLSELPSSYDAFAERLRAGQVDVEQVAEALGVSGKCYVCEQTIVNGEAFVEAIADYYGVDIDYDLLGDLYTVTDCCADDANPRLCSYHGYQATKDD